ncbi:formyltransferase family protein, partial [Candidatus Kapabacteria bacterium]|nr:formyltransferase family protein [Candidatus Kapabacteria bacterium]
KEPDILFCFGWSSLIKKDLLEMAEMGIIGFHPAKLPKNRGRHPLIWALALGLEESASTFFFMDEGADTGDILSQKDFKIAENDDAKSLYNKVSNIALTQIEEFVSELENGTFKKNNQDHSESNNWRKRGKGDGKIDFRMSSSAIFNLVRALTKPYIGAHLEYNNEEIKVWKVEKVKLAQKNLEGGKILNIEDNTITVKTYDGAIRILEHDFEALPKIGEYL